MNYLVVIVLVVFSAFFSALTLGLMSLDTQTLKRKMSLKDKDAKKVYAIRKNGNLLLTTLLIGNVAVNSSLAVFLGSIASGVIAGFVATGLIVIFGEIIPQAVFSRFALILGSKVAWLVKVFIFILYPIAWPIARVLDKVLGEELPTVYSKRELMKIIEEHEESSESDVKAEEERIVKGALTFSEKTVRDVMTPRIATEAFEYSQKIDKNFIENLLDSGFSRLPIYKGEIDNVVGILYTKDLLGDKNLDKRVGQVADKKVFFVDENKRLGYVFNVFLRTHHHLFIVINEFGGMAGVITLEDVLEEIIKSEIMDEGDRYKDLRRVMRKLSRKKRKTI